MVLVSPSVAFAMAALMGLGLFVDAWKGHVVGKGFARLHAAVALFGSALMIFVAVVEGDTRHYNNIGMAAIIILLGIYMGFNTHKGKPAKAVLLVPAGLPSDVTCYWACMP